MAATSLEDFYKETSLVIPEGISKEIGHFNVFNIADITARIKTGDRTMPYNRRDYFKISLICGKNRAEYADKVIEIGKSALLFATPRVPYHYMPYDTDQSGYFCIFTADFLCKFIKGVDPNDLPIFQPGAYPVFQLTDEAVEELTALFKKITKELASDYTYKYDLIRTYVLELIHYGQKLQPASALHHAHTASARVSSLFVELLERQFPIESVHQKLALRTAKDYADRLSVHVNHLNKVLKEHTGKTTTDIISSRVIREAKILLRQTDWTVSEIAWSLGFEEVAHFSNFFKKQTSLTPLAFRA